jgi:tRNA (guanine6-N2)-methyltransferase
MPYTRRRTGPAGEQNKGKDRPGPGIMHCVAETPAGLEDIARAELILVGRGRLNWSTTPLPRPGELEFTWRGSPKPLAGLKTIHAVYSILTHPVPRPKGLLGHEHFQHLLAQIETARTAWPPGAFHTLYLSAAGSDSSVMERLKNEIATQAGLEVASIEGDLLLRIRPAQKGQGWQTLVRLSPRPLATRSWRVCNYEGALNATVAHAMCLLTNPTPGDVFINLACGSGSLLLERLDCAPSQLLVGLDTDLAAVDCALRNLAASKKTGNIQLLLADASQVPLRRGCATALVADLPFGHLVGSHATNLDLYPALLSEAARLAAPGAFFALISHEVRLLETLLERSPDWHTRQVRRVALGGLNPRIFLLERRVSS